MKSGPPPKHVYEQRIDFVFGLILRGCRRYEVCEAVRKKWGGCNGTADRYLEVARKRLEVYLREKRETLFAEHIAVRRSLRERAVKAKDLRLELEVVRDEAKLLGLYPADRIEMKVEDVDAAIERELARLSAGSEAANAGTAAGAPDTVH